MKFETEEDILSIVRGFETGTIGRGEWGHAEHLAVALYYLSNHDFEYALTKMREGIFDLLRAFEIDLSKEMPYHETLTVFWMRTIDDFKASRNGAAIEDVCGELVEIFDKDYPLKFYSRELLYSAEARMTFVEPDKSSDLTTQAAKLQN